MEDGMKRIFTYLCNALLVLVLFILDPFHIKTVEAGWQPFQYSTPILAQSGNLGSTTIFTAPVSGYYVISVFTSTASAVALSSETMTINFTSDGVARSI